ncbi:MAG: thioredoxin fold domain-containing protein [Proteobacteria bacterium]|nr:thioredoxin fold domain-containing protein [Pseudomonadota bacterium]
MKRFFILLVVSCVASLNHAQADRVDHKVMNILFEPIIEIDFINDSRRASTEGKHLMVMFVKDGCVPCIKMKQQVLSDPKVTTFFKQNFISYRVNIFGDLPVIDHGGKMMTEKTYARREGIWGTPTFHFYGANGQLIRKRTGFLSVRDFIGLGEHVVSRSYKTAKSTVNF